ncbi:hypothetical protein ACFQL1_18585 [Halomicroarcula sp. GCM10025709]|uniref:hypothetical protein n=1 Tax=Haloarcula TaxID=2237 RepID=UPI0024C2EEE0|nr:hypothetical protein [Halomicroarcula sp. YJ-61-S]
MVSITPLVVGAGFVAVAIGGLLEVTGYDEEQRRAHRRLAQVFTYGCIVMLGLGGFAIWTGATSGVLPVWAVVALAVVTVGVLWAQWKLRRAIDADE